MPTQLAIPKHTQPILVLQQRSQKCIYVYLELGFLSFPFPNDDTRMSVETSEFKSILG